MKLANRTLSSALLVITCLALIACSGVPGGNSGGGGGGTTGSYSIGGTVANLTGTGLTLLNNGGNSLTVLPGATTFTFTQKIASGKPYAVTVASQPANPAQTCTVTSGTGTATANVSGISISCTTNPVTATIGGTVTNLAPNSAVILQNNAADSLTVTANGTFTFKTPVTGPTDAYAVTVLTQPNSPNQICTVSNGTGTATANVTNVGVNCVPSFTIGGTVTGLLGSGLILQNSATLEQLPITAATGNQTYTFTKLVPTGAAYTVSIFAQPTNPVQTCVVTPATASGTASANVNNATVTCPAVTYSIGGTVVGLAGNPPTNGPLTDNSFTLEDALGNTLGISQNGPFTFATPFALNDQYQVSIFTLPTTQSQGCTRWNYKGVVTANVTDILVDCAHSDWTWIDGTKIAGLISAPQYGSFPTSAATTTPNPYTNTPGARHGGAGWTDAHGNLWLFGGEGWELSGGTPPDTLDAPMNDLWVCQMYYDQQCQWQLAGAYGLFGAGIILNAQHENQLGIYSNVGNAVPYPTPIPGGRWGAATWTDSAGNFWMFGGNGNSDSATGLLNDLWKYDMSVYNLPGSTLTGNVGTWSWVGGSNGINQAGTYSGGTLIPGARVNAATWTDAAGNFWMFGGYGFDGSKNEGYLNDLWEFSGGKWIFLSGGSTNLANQWGVYGTQGTPGASNIPGARHEAVTWLDLSGNLWLFGGEGEDSMGTANGILNDLWMYNPTSNQWTWVTGSNVANQTGSYGLNPSVGPVNTTGAAGTLGLPTGNSGIFPGSRWGAAGWTDEGGNFYLFGGWGLDSTATNGNGALNDTWVYAPSSTVGQPGTWTWIKGSNTGGANGVYGDEVRPYKTYNIYTPGGRSGATYWIDNSLDLNKHKYHQLWLFGGEGYDSTSTTGNGYLNDMWRYLPYQDY